MRLQGETHEQETARLRYASAESAYRTLAGAVVALMLQGHESTHDMLQRCRRALDAAEEAKERWHAIR